MSTTINSPIQWGVNGHPFWSHGGISVTKQLDLIKQMGLQSYRVDLDNSDAGSMNLLRTLVTEGKARGIDILPIINLHPERYTTEAAAYSAGKAIAATYAKAFPGMTWELGNEYDNLSIKAGASGALASDYNNAPYAIARGLIKGMYDGAKGADATAKTVVDDAGWHHYGFLQRLAADGVKWDITAMHWYSDQGSPMNVGGGGVDALAIHQKLGEPIWITEVNARPGSMGEAAEAQWLVKTMADWNAVATKYGIQAAHIYELFDQPEMGTSPEAHYGLYTSTGAYKPMGTAVDNYMETWETTSPPPPPPPTPVDPVPVPPADADYTPPVSAAPTKFINGTTADNTLTGSSAHEKIDGKAGSDTMSGQGGDDTYVVDRITDKVVEGTGQGIDTIHTLVSTGYSLPANVENLIYMGGSGAKIAGNSLNNHVNGGPGNDFINTGAGKDASWGRGGADTFIFVKGQAHDVIADFQGGAGAGDKLKLVGYGFDDFSDVKPLLVQDGADTTLVLSNVESVHLLGI
ncbi:MAG TPA: hypothetical protein VEX87_19395, partial [Skermanella sp.]|nr:hypothetical protein [Skermanella sp.]